MSPGSRKRFRVGFVLILFVMKRIVIFCSFCLLVLFFQVSELHAQVQFQEDGITYYEVTSLQQFAELSCDIGVGTSEWNELPALIQSMMLGDVDSALAGCYGKRGNRKCKKSGGLCVKSTSLEFDDLGNIIKITGGMVDNNGNLIDPPGEGKLYYGIDEFGEIIVTFRSI